MPVNLDQWLSIIAATTFATGVLIWLHVSTEKLHKKFFGDLLSDDKTK
ncbi:MAG: hypothetical protein LBK53_06560 [Heliobacteriaceae bacterium]|jgi:uncharacterized membrane protein|nr:hypothetical protein [Heliobacteriaceae bacterium]